ncbi:glutamine cyclotransferase [Terrimonas sp.]|uniref:glutaminyl-peptide cyclotransferase n=1 Tax=Terrimonas sp. TaxID=1914338 RepID=UPI000D51FE60|nr:glutaminyl-peptide cyclotransferase [Terrimonas sp.]PVD49818.1 glutamine cyclotransferase [Terrimonas sp.]
MRNISKVSPFLFCLLVLLHSCVSNNKQDDTASINAVPRLSYKLVNTYPHDTSAFTEGLAWYKGKLYESTGSPDNMPHTKSYFGVVDIKSGVVKNKIELDRKIFFGEGIAIINDTVFQLTYKNRKGFLYNVNTLQKTGEFSYNNKEGWGLTTDGKRLIMSDGTDMITWIDPHSFKVEKALRVSENGNAVSNLNELEYINGYIFANVYTTNTIVKINAETGEIIGKLDLWNIDKMARDEYPKALHMNGIAYDSTTNKLLVTGKMWPKYFELELL